MTHPKMNLTNPTSSPKPLFFTTDFIRRTYLEYILPLLPPEAYKKSSKIANRYVFKYGDATPCPDDPNDAWLEDLGNWPEGWSSKQSRERFGDAVGRTMMIALAIDDPVQGAMIMQGRFDWVSPVDVKALVQPILNQR